LRYASGQTDTDTLVAPPAGAKRGEVMIAPLGGERHADVADEYLTD